MSVTPEHCRLLTSHEAAERLGIREKLLRAWRIVGKGPAYIRVGGRIKYSPDDVEQWLAVRRVGAGANEPGKATPPKSLVQTNLFRRTL